MHRGSYHAQILGDERQGSEFLANAVKEIILGSVDPAAVHRGRLRRGNFPALFEAAEMINAQQVAHVHGPAQALQPPLVSARLEHVPAIQGIAPTLPGFAESVRRHSRDYLRLQVLVEPENFRMCPHVGAVIIHKNGDVADYADGACRAVLTQGAPLLKEEELQNTADLQFPAQFAAGLVQRRWGAVRQVPRPLIPRLLVALPQSLEKNPAFHPP